jgi:hypothetical protein
VTGVIAVTRWSVSVAALALVLVPTPPAASANAPKPATRFAQLANRCFTMAPARGRSRVVSTGVGYRVARVPARRAERFHVKPTAIGSVMLHDGAGKLVATSGTSSGVVMRGDAPGKAAEWALKRARGRSFVLTATDGARGTLGVDPQSHALVIGVATRFRFTRARGCREFPEAGLGVVKGRPRFRKFRDGTLFGFADAHLHVTANQRAGGAVIYGENFNRFGIGEALGHDADVHGEDGSQDFTGNLLRDGSPAGTHDTHGWPTFAGWPVFDTYTHQQVYYRWLQRAYLAGLRLVVAQTVEDTPLCNIEPNKVHSCDETESVELQVRQLRALEEYVDAQEGGRGRGWFRIVESPAAARRAIEEGKLAVVIGIEWSDPFGCSESMGQPQCTREDIDRGIARIRALGIRALFVAHWIDNALAGAALEGGDTGSFIAAMQISQTGLPFQTGACPQPEQGVEQPPFPGRQCNTKGLTELGEYAMGKLMDNHLLIEADHLSEWARESVLKIAERRHYPLISSHTNTGGLWTASDLRRLYALAGFATATIDDVKTVAARVVEFKPFAAGRDGLGVGIGSDTGGFNALPAPDDGDGSGPFKYPFRAYLCGLVLAPQKTGERTFDINKDGVAHYGLVPDLLADVQRRPKGGEALKLLFRSADAYLRTWAKTGA